MNIMLGKNCAACGKERKLKALRFDPETLLPYCDNPYICENEDEHPNSARQIVLRGGSLEMLSYAEAVEAHKNQLLERHDHDTVEQIRRLLAMPTTVRINDPEMAKFVIGLKQRLGDVSLSDVFRYCIELVMNGESKFDGTYEIEKQKKEQEDKTAAFVQSVEKPAPAEPAPVPLGSSDNGNFGTF